MKIFGTKNNLPFSWIIRKGLDQESSHIIFVFDDSITTHSNPVGIHLVWFNSFKKHNHLNWGLSIITTKEQDKEILAEIMDKHDQEPYDWPAFIYFAWRAFLKIVFKRPIPRLNKWASSHASLCVALPSKTPESFLGGLKEAHLEMVSPDELKAVIIKELQRQGYVFNEIKIS